METGHDEMSSEKRMWKMKRREYMAMRMLTAVIVIVFIFWCGFEFGEIRASVGLAHGYGGQRMGMMQRAWSVSPVEYNGTMPRTSTTPQPMTMPAQTTGAATN